MDDLYVYEPDSQSEKILLSLCGDVILLKHGSDNRGRQWLEYWKKNTGIVIQKNNLQEPWIVYLIKKDTIKTFCYSYSLGTILKFFDVCGLTLKILQKPHNLKKQKRSTTDETSPRR